MSWHKRFWVVAAIASLGAGGYLGYTQIWQEAPPHLPPSVSLAPQPGEVSPIRPEVQRELDVCFLCHGAGGVSLRPQYPTIAGQKPDYIHRHLQFIRLTGAEPSEEVVYTNEVGDPFDSLRKRMPHRINPDMGCMAKSVPSALLNSVVQALAGLPCDGGQPKVKTENRPTLPTKANRCIVCHGQNGISAEPNTPNLAGQHQAYLRRELLMIRDSARGLVPASGAPSRSHPTMEAQEEVLTDSDIEQITGYFAALDCRGGM